MTHERSIGLVILARLDSRRLPGKALRPVAGRPLLGRVVDRARRVHGVARVIIATSDRALDDPIAAFAVAEDVALFRGAADDVLGRCLVCAETHGWSHVMRISGDSPFFDPELATRMAADPALATADILTNVAPRSFPPGNSIEIVTLQALRRAAAEARSDSDREHVTAYIYRHPQRFRITNVAAPDARFQGVTLSVDREQDMAMAEWIAGRLEPPVAAAPFDTIVALQRAWASQGTAT